MPEVTSNMVCPHEDGIEYSSFTADINIEATFGHPARAIEIVTAASGTLVVETMRGSRTFTALASGTWLGGQRGLQVRRIIASGTANVTLVRVWL